MEFILIRHGQTYANEQNIYSTPNSKLSNIGKKNLEISRTRLEKIFYDRIISSPYIRALETGVILNRKNIQIEKLEEIREMSFGILEGKSFDQVYSSHPKELQRWMKDPYEIAPLGGESIVDIMDRAKIFLSKDFEGSPIFITHDGFIRACLCSILEDPHAFFRFEIRNGSINRIKRENGIFTIVQING